jgi:hypothetical protein
VILDTNRNLVGGLALVEWSESWVENTLKTSLFTVRDRTFVMILFFTIIARHRTLIRGILAIVMEIIFRDHFISESRKAKFSRTAD